MRVYVRSTIYRLALGCMDVNVTAIMYVSVPCLHLWARMQTLHGNCLLCPIYWWGKCHKEWKLVNQYMVEMWGQKGMSKQNKNEYIHEIFENILKTKIHEKFYLNFWNKMLRNKILDLWNRSLISVFISYINIRK